MSKHAAVGVATIIASILLAPQTRAQDRASSEAAIDVMRKVSSLSQSDQQRIRDWAGIVIVELDAAKGDLAAAGNAFRATIDAQYRNRDNTPAFRSEFAAQMAAVAAAQFADSNTKQRVSRWLAQVLLDMNTIETLPGLLAGLTAQSDAARYLSARAIIGLQTAIAADNAKLQQVVAALKAAGTQEKSSVVLGRIYRALAIPGQAAGVVDAYLAIFDSRLAARRNENAPSGAETVAFMYFSDPANLQGLSPAQKGQIVARVAVFFRLDAERYTDPLLTFEEIDMLERALVEAEALFQAVGAKNGGDVANLLDAQGRAAKDQIPAEAAKWVGDASSDTKGGLNEALWGVPVGAP